MTAIVDWLPVSLPLAVLATTASYVLYELMGRYDAWRFRRKLRRLPLRPRAACALRDAGRLSYGEIAQVLGCTPDEVSRLIHTGREALRHVTA